MAKRGYIPFEKDDLPVEFEIELGGTDYVLGLNYNESQDIFTVDLWDIEQNPLVLGEKLVLNERLWQDVINEDLPATDLVPMDESGAATEITYDNFMDTVFLFEDDLPPDADEPSLENEDDNEVEDE